MEWFSQPLYKHCVCEEISGGDTDGGTMRFGPYSSDRVLAFSFMGRRFPGISCRECVDPHTTHTGRNFPDHAPRVR
jgi:hypothetical protein